VTSLPSHTRTRIGDRRSANGPRGDHWALDFRQYSFHPAMQVLRVCEVCAFSAPPAFPPCSCPFHLLAPVRRLTSRISSKSYPDSREYSLSCCGAQRGTSERWPPSPSGRSAARATLGGEFPTGTLSVVPRVPSSPMVHVSASPPLIPDGRLSRVRLAASDVLVLSQHRLPMCLEA
jgi:hypothetical protein